MRFHLILSLMLFSASSFAADQAAWQKLVSQAVSSKITQQDSSGNEFHSLQRLTNTDPAVTRTANYFSAVGHTEADGSFTSNHIDIVSENWQVGTDGVRHIDQWGYSLSLDGQVTFVMHQVFSESADGDVLTDEEPAVPALTDSALLSQVNAKVQEWEGASSL